MIVSTINIFRSEDYDYVHTGDTLDFCVRKDGVKVYEGTAETSPDDVLPTVYINRIAAYYLGHSDFSPIETGMTKDADAAGVFALYQVLEESGVTTEVLIGEDEYNYGYIMYIVDGTGDYVGGILSEPVNGHADPRMFLQLTCFCPQDETITITT